MADNTSTKVLTIDTGNAISNVKDFKARIEELKGTLLGLEKGTDNYNAVAKELRNTQQKLTEVMDVAKGKAEGVEGSYDNLVAKMRQLKQEWRATADEATRTNLGAQILDINNQLKELDASTGNFQRNVGDYANAFENAFRAMVGGIGRFNPELAKTAATVSSLIPVIKQTATVATASLQGIKKAIASTGIGLLVIAVGLVAANWEKVTEEIQKAIPGGKRMLEIEKQTANASELIRRTKESSAKETDYQVRLLRAQGAEEKTILQLQIKNQKVEIARLEAVNKRLGAAFQEADLYAKNTNFWWDLFGIAEDKAIKARDDAAAASSAANVAVEDAKKELKILEAEMDTVINKSDSISPGSSQKEEDDGKKQEDADKKRIEAIKKRIEQETLTEKELLKKKYDEELALLQKYGEDTTALTKAYNDALEKIDKKEAEEKRKLLVAETDKTIKELQDKANNDTVKLKLEFEKSDLDDLDFSFFKSGDSISPQAITAQYEDAASRLNKQYEIQKGALEGEKSELEKLLAQLKPDTDEYISTKQRIAEVEMEISNATTQNEISNLELLKEKDKELMEARKAHINNTAAALQSLGNLLGSIGDIMEEQINTEVENGEISEEMGKKRFESVKAMQIAATVINTIAGAIGAFMQASSTYPAPYGQIIGGITAAAVTAAGVVQIAQIKRQKYGSDSSGSISTPNLQRASMPTQIQPVQNITGQDETTQLANAINSQPVIVKVTDIDDVNQIKDSTIAESTF